MKGFCVVLLHHAVLFFAAVKQRFVVRLWSFCRPVLSLNLCRLILSLLLVFHIIVVVFASDCGSSVSLCGRFVSLWSLWIAVIILHLFLAFLHLIVIILFLFYRGFVTVLHLSLVVRPLSSVVTQALILTSHCLLTVRRLLT